MTLVSTYIEMPKTLPDLLVGLGLNMGWRRVEAEAGARLSKADRGVDAYDAP